MVTEGGRASRGRRPGTAERLREAGLELFAERGYDSVTVGQIEERVGLVPRRGAMYRHFAGKEELLTSAVEHHLESVASARERFGRSAGSGPVAAYELGRWILAELDRQRVITRVLERDGERLPALRERFRTEVSEAGYAAMREILATWLVEDRKVDGDGSAREVDPAPWAAPLLLGALVNLRRSAWTFGTSPAGLSDEAALTGWAELCATVVRAEGTGSAPAERGHASSTTRPASAEPG